MSLTGVILALSGMLLSYVSTQSANGPQWLPLVAGALLMLAGAAAVSMAIHLQRGGQKQ